MPRAPRRLLDNGLYHLISRGNNHTPVLEISGGYQKFIDVLKTALSKFDWKIYHYCLMPNHVHILANIKNSQELSRIMQYILQEYSRWFRKQNEYVGYLWQGRYKSPLVENDVYFLQCARYIERNPIRANLVSKPENYPWSSYRHYALGETNPIVHENPLYQDFGLSEISRRNAYREFISLETLRESMPDKTIRQCVSLL